MLLAEKMNLLLRKRACMKYSLLTLIFLSLILNSCQKDEDRKLLNGYFRYTVNGTETVIKDETGLNANTFDCIIKGDTALYINVTKIYDGAGFVIKSDSIRDGTYQLDSMNKAYFIYPTDLKRYYTTNKYKGTLTIKKGTFMATELLNTLTGQFSFQAVDTLTGKNFNVVNGSFLMERKETN